jgi:hypothetical protein
MLIWDACTEARCISQMSAAAASQKYAVSN